MQKLDKGKCWKEWQNQRDVKDAKAGKRVRTRKTVKSGSGQNQIKTKSDSMG